MGSEDNNNEVKIRELLCPDVKKRVVEFLRDYVDVFAWSYQDMPGLGTDIMEHRLPLKPECPPIKHKLRRTRPDMATEEDHVGYFLKLFQRLRKFKLRLNPNKCNFGVRSGKPLGFIVSQKGIEVDPDKVKSIREMPTPKTEK
ncbi:uncharacterized protein LOC127137996 [Lathyrus oleraceus]|uniref:uncharacterized protein LOC127137996 n=1 Tax=Pisum sativum TaxID=3888 RepID=UPI0021D2FEDB|nr:uncharacterized protein LOC127137996 [Pisum sativum]